MQSPLFIGVDVAKAEVVAACSQMSFPVRKVANTVPELKKLLKCLPAGSCIAMEVTGIYHRTLADLAHRAGFKVYVLNPKDMRHYAKGVGMRAKTDRVDSLVIARFLAHEIKQLRAYEPPTPTQRAIDELLKRRATLVAHKTAIQLTCSQMTVLKKRAAKLTAGFDEILQFIDQEIAALTTSVPQRAEQAKRLETISGVGPLTSAWLANLLDRVKFKNSDALVAFTGMDPRPSDSGQKHGRRRLSKRGPAEGRRLLYNVGMAAARSKTWKQVYEHYRKLGWASTPTILIIARKILRIAFAIYKSGATFDPKMVRVGA